MLLHAISNFFSIAIELTVLFISVSFLINLLQGIIPYNKMEQLMQKSHPLVGSIMMLFFAFITPFCSCSTIPIVVNLLHKKVRFPIVVTFLFASPILDPTILTLMTVLLGWKVTLIYTGMTSVLSIMIGFSLSVFGFEHQVKKVHMSGYHSKTYAFNLKEAFNETWHLMKTVYPYLLLGAGIGAFIHGAIPSHWIVQYLGGDQWWLIPVAAVVGIPLYIRLSTMVPISQILIAKGMALGPVMALVISSAGASLPELTLLNTIFKKKLLLAFIFSVLTMSTLSGILFYII